MTEFPKDGNTFSDAHYMCVCLLMSPAFDRTYEGNLHTHVRFQSDILFIVHRSSIHPYHQVY